MNNKKKRKKEKERRKRGERENLRFSVYELRFFGDGIEVIN